MQLILPALYQFQISLMFCQNTLKSNRVYTEISASIHCRKIFQLPTGCTQRSVLWPSVRIPWNSQRVPFVDNPDYLTNQVQHKTPFPSTHPTKTPINDINSNHARRARRKYILWKYIVNTLSSSVSTEPK